MLYKGDDAIDFITIDLEMNGNYKISRADFKCGNLPVMTFKSPVFPIKISLCKKQTRELKHQNNCYLAIYDEYGNKKTCDGHLLLIAKEEVVK